MTRHATAHDRGVEERRGSHAAGSSLRVPAGRFAVVLLAAGVFEPAFGLVLRPETAALLMSGSSLIVAVNALPLKRLSLRAAAPGPAGVPVPREPVLSRS